MSRLFALPPHRSDRPGHPAARTLTLLAFIGLACLLAPTAQGQDLVGLYWDAAFTTNLGATPTVPGVLTGYVVLHDPTGTGGVLGWEACFDVDGPGVVTGWDFQGQAINVGSGDCVTVGYASPLPPGADILLGTFQFAVTAEGPIEIAMEPPYNASLPGTMSYIPGDDPEALLAMTTATGMPGVAGVNGGNPFARLSTELLDFGIVPFGSTATLVVDVVNDGELPLAIEPSITALCDFFFLPEDVPAEVAPHTTLPIVVAFSPVQERQVTCHLVLSADLPAVTLRGTGTAPAPGWSIIGNGSFGDVYLTQTATRPVSLQNTGQTVFQLAPAFLDSCPDFQLFEGGEPRDLLPGQTATFRVRFAPTVLGYQNCFLDTGVPGIPPIPFEGFGRPLQTSWDAPTQFDFLSQYVGVPATGSITITNTGGAVIPLHASLPAGCDGFTITQGGGYDIDLQPGQSHAIGLQFLPQMAQAYECLLDLGSVVTPIPIRGTGLPGPGPLTFTPSELVFSGTLAGQTSDLTLSMSNVAPYDVTVAAALDSTGSPAFTIVAGGGEQILAPGDGHQVLVRYAPTAAGEDASALSFGNGLPTVPVSGSAYVGSADCRIEPAALDWGAVAVGSFLDLDVTVHNDGDTPLLLATETTDPAFFIDTPPVTVGSGQQHTFTVRFQPTAPGPRAGSLLFGDLACNGVPLTGEGVINPAWFSVVPDTVDIPAVSVGTVVERDIMVTSTAPEPIDLNVQILAPTFGFNLLEGEGPSVLYPFESKLVRLRFLCVTARTYETNLQLGPGLPLVPIFAEGVVIRPDCELELTTLNFGNRTVGSRNSRTLTVTNNSEDVLALAPTSDNPAFTAAVVPSNVQPDSSAVLTVWFEPDGVGTYAGAVTLGNALCTEVLVYGEGRSNTLPFTDLLGIYWDEQHFDYNIWVTEANTVVEGYLVLAGPSTEGGVLAWECRVETVGSAQILGWSLAGQNINIGQDPDFVVGLATPLPYWDDVVLASFECLVVDPFGTTLFSLLPTRIPSVPGQMSWVPGSDPDLLLPMRTVTGVPEVASINGDGIVGLQVPTPTARQAGGQVQLSWPAPRGDWDGCHVYRRNAGLAAERVTTSPVGAAGEVVTWSDDLGGMAPGTRLFYSYAPVKDGTEHGRSPEVEIMTPDLPLAATRLLPNVPNPFNPMTEIRFELGRAQSVDLKIYDVTGRLVRTLVAGNRASGRHAEVWQGRDDLGRTVPSGTYYVRLVTRDGVENRKIMLLK